MNIQPTTPLTTVKVLRGVPIHDDYKDTLTFTSLSNQFSYFLTKEKYSFTGLTPVKSLNTIRLPINADKIADCNYLLYQNENYLNKWFYCFIKDIQFVNSNSCNVIVEIDCFQTWLFDFDIPQVFVEREHVNDDTIGANLIDENLETGEYVRRYVQQYGLSNSTYHNIVVWLSEDLSGPLDGQYIQNIYTGLFGKPYLTNEQGISALNNFIKEMTENNKIEAIAGITVLPQIMTPINNEVSLSNFNIIRNTSDINGYIPKNNKLFTYPYNFVILTNGLNQTQELRYEFMSETNPSCKVWGNYGMNTEVQCVPTSYKGFGEAIGESVSINSFPMCAFNVDTYKAWLAQNQGFYPSQIASIGAGIIGTVASAATGNFIGALTGFAGIANSLGQIASHESLPSVSRGNSQSSALFANNRLDFYLYGMTITKEFAKIIDDYFQAYGYKVNEIKEPNIRGRQYWNFVKTIDCKVTGNIPNDDLINIAQAFDRGITFWHDQEIGNYERINSIV